MEEGEHSKLECGEDLNTLQNHNSFKHFKLKGWTQFCMHLEVAQKSIIT